VTSWLLPPLPPRFDAALRDVHARSNEARLAAAERLGQPDAGRESEALEGLLTLCRDRDGRVRAAALRGLPGHDDPRVTREILDALDDGDALVREVAVVSLAGIDDPRALPALERALHSPHPEVRFQAAESYVQAHEAPEPSRLEPLLDDDDARVREGAVLALSALGAAAADGLARAVDDPVWRVRARAALALAEQGDERGAGLLVQALGDPELVVPALDALAQLQHRPAIEPIAAIAQAYLKPLPLKVAAARALCRMQDARGVPVLRSVLRAFRPDGRSYAAEVIGELGLTELEDELQRLKYRPRGADPEVVDTSLRALRASGRDEALTAPAQEPPGGR
jgi:HEAT repeat protein